MASSNVKRCKADLLSEAVLHTVSAVPGKVISLVRPPISEDAAQAARDLLEDVLAGRTVGFAIAAMHKPHSWTLDVAGECKRCPALTRGRLAELDDAIAAAPPPPPEQA